MILPINKVHCFITYSPQGDGNFSFEHDDLLLLQVSSPIPRKGMETLAS